MTKEVAGINTRSDLKSCTVQSRSVPFAKLLFFSLRNGFEEREEVRKEEGEEEEKDELREEDDAREEEENEEKEEEEEIPLMYNS